MATYVGKSWARRSPTGVLPAEATPSVALRPEEFADDVPSCCPADLVDSVVVEPGNSTSQDDDIVDSQRTSLTDMMEQFLADLSDASDIESCSEDGSGSPKRRKLLPFSDRRVR